MSRYPDWLRCTASPRMWRQGSSAHRLRQSRHRATRTGKSRTTSTPATPGRPVPGATAPRSTPSRARRRRAGTRPADTTVAPHGTVPARQRRGSPLTGGQQLRQIRHQFIAYMHEGVNILTELGYNPTRFRQMLHYENDHGVTVARRLVMAHGTDGLRWLKQMGRLDMSVEIWVLHPEHEDLFDQPTSDPAYAAGDTGRDRGTARRTSNERALRGSRHNGCMDDSLRRRLEDARISEDADQLVDVGCDLAERGEHEAAADCFSRAIRMGAEWATHNLGNELVSLGRDAQSIEYFERSIAIGQSESLLNLGQVVERLGDFVRAAAIYRRAMNAGDVNAGMSLAFLMHERGKRDEAEQAAASAARAGSPLARAVLATWQWDRHRDVALEDELRSSVGVYDSARAALADLLESTDRPAEALALLKAGAERNESASWLPLGNLYIRLGREADAEAAFRRGIAVGDAWSHHNLATLLDLGENWMRRSTTTERPRRQGVRSQQKHFRGWSNRRRLYLMPHHAKAPPQLKFVFLRLF